MHNSVNEFENSLEFKMCVCFLSISCVERFTVAFNLVSVCVIRFMRVTVQQLVGNSAAWH